MYVVSLIVEIVITTCSAAQLKSKSAIIYYRKKDRYSTSGGEESPDSSHTGMECKLRLVITGVLSFYSDFPDIIGVQSEFTRI